MDIITRLEAKEKGLKIYYTGKPCKNAHDSYRYVQSGTCAACVKQSNGIVSPPNFEAKRAAKMEMVRVNIRCFDDDRESVAAAAWAMACCHWPFLTQSDIDPKLSPKFKEASGTAIHTFLCHHSDAGALIELANDIRRSKRTVDVAEARKSGFGVYGNYPIAPVPDFARVPIPGDPDYDIA